MTIRSARRFQILVVGAPQAADILPVRIAWHLAGADLLGPVDVGGARMDDCLRLDGVLIVLDAEAGPTQRLADRLDDAHVPFLFLLPDGLRDPATPGFCLSADQDEILEIIDRLSRQNDGMARH
ncbi:hypothetical protein [Rhizobium sp. Leaf341]|uniref:hypothetical protein n=1 Tax=Rhizobium sp. Leaf341 TaxID=1736344 RepID=UPI0012E35F22|nr:hypothetical protein [Rhizobium sp. Leaf341]